MQIKKDIKYLVRTTFEGRDASISLVVEISPNEAHLIRKIRLWICQSTKGSSGGYLTRKL